MHRSLNRFGGASAISGLMAPMLALAALPVRAAPADVAGNAALTSDYVWRGSTQTHGDPALQAGARLTGAAGWYASAWASNVRFAPAAGAHAELDLGIGWSGRTGKDWTLDASLLQYRYPSAAVALDWTEFDATATWKDRCWVSLGWSNEALGSRRRGMYTLVGAKWPVNPRLRIETAAGYYALGDIGGDGHDDGYAHALASAVWTLAAPARGPALDARVTVHATDARARRTFGDGFAGSRIEAALQASF